MPLDHARIGAPGAPHVYSYTWKDVVLYALAIGATRDELDFLDEARGPHVFPTFVSLPKLPALAAHLASAGGQQEGSIHVAERIDVHHPFPPAGTLTSVCTIRGIYGMGRFTQVVIATDTRDASGQLLTESTSWALFRDEPAPEGSTAPDDGMGPLAPLERAADAVTEQPTGREQALLYRLCGDTNRIHIDLDAAKELGFAEGPILHGMCTLGYAVRHAALAAGPGGARRITRVEARFRRPVWPGDVLVSSTWRTDPGRLVLQLKSKERPGPAALAAAVTFGA